MMKSFTLFAGLLMTCAFLVSGGFSFAQDENPDLDGITKLAADIHVGIYFDPQRGIKPMYGSEGMHMALDEYGFDVEFTKKLDLDSMNRFDLLVLPVVHEFPPGIDPKALFLDVRKFVAGGKGVVLIKHSWLFPEIGTYRKIPVGDKKIYAPITYTPIEVVATNHPVTRGLPPVFDVQYDGSPLSVRPGGIPLLRFSTNGMVRGRKVVLDDVPVVIVGEFGKGRVALMGTFIGIDKHPREFENSPEGPMLRMFLNAVLWASGRDQWP